jgi:biotin transport system substrate-specific component
MEQTLSFTVPRFRSLMRATITFVLAVLFIVVCAKIRIPFWPVPLTIHTLAVMGIAVAAGPRFATASFLAYLAAGATGFPVFAGTPERGIGLAYMAGPTGGYLAGYLAACWITGVLARGRGILGQIGAMLAGLVATYAGGLAWLLLFVPAKQVIPLGFTPFILGDLINVGMIAVGIPLIPSRFVRLLRREVP